MEYLGPGIPMAELFIQPSTIDAIVGTVTGGVANIQEWQDGTFLEVMEEAATPSMNLEVIFSGVRKVCGFCLGLSYQDDDGLHYVQVQVYDNVTETWKTIWTLNKNNGNTNFCCQVPSANSKNLTDGDGNVRVRLYNPDAGDIAHGCQIDFMALRGF